VTETALRAFVANRLAAFEVPVRIDFRPDALPRNANGKILKAKLKRSAGGLAPVGSSNITC
jgi:long-chain acyl-CoA synthetase